MRLLPLAVAVLAAAPVAAQGLRPAPAGDVAAAIRSCLAAEDAGAGGAARLEADGWRRATTVKDGVTAPVEPPIYGSAANRALVILARGEGGSTCVTLARVESARALPDAIAAVRAAFPGEAVAAEGASPSNQWWRSGEHLFNLATTGTPAAPSLRIAVARAR